MKEIRQLISKETAGHPLHSFDAVYRIRSRNTPRYWVYGILIFLIAILFLPWTQNIRSRGTITTLRQEQRPQELPAIIGGRIVKWYVKEGDFVKTGDTIAQLEETKDAYLDPKLLERTKQQLEGKKSSVGSYQDKVKATDLQIGALEANLQLKLRQSQNKIDQLTLKIQSDSIELLAAVNDLSIAQAQYARQQIMRDSGLASTLQVEQRNQSYQQAIAKRTAAEVKLRNSRTELNTSIIDLSQVRQEYAEKIFKSQGDRAAAQGEIALGEAEIAKLSNQYSNYAIRSGYYYIKAPQDGQVVNAARAGINEIVKEGEIIVSIVPTDLQYAVELFVNPVDLPLLQPGQKARFQFDGFPAIVFSGWPTASYGMFDGRVAAVQSNISTNGKFRVLLAEDTSERKWPEQLKIGTGVSGIALLKDVPVWYELWRNINGFPPDYYTPAKTVSNEKK